MRLSLLKAAHAVVSGGAYRKSGSPVFFGPRTLRRTWAPVQVLIRRGLIGQRLRCFRRGAGGWSVCRCWRRTFGLGVVGLDEFVRNVHVARCVPNNRISIRSALDHRCVTMLLGKGLQKSVNLLCDSLKNLF